MSQYQVNALGRHYIGFLISFENRLLQYQMVMMKILRFIASFFCFFKKAAEVGLDRKPFIYSINSTFQ